MPEAATTTHGVRPRAAPIKSAEPGHSRGLRVDRRDEHGGHLDVGDRAAANGVGVA